MSSLVIVKLKIQLEKSLSRSLLPLKLISSPRSHLSRLVSSRGKTRTFHFHSVACIDTTLEATHGGTVSQHAKPTLLFKFRGVESWKGQQRR